MDRRSWLWRRKPSDRSPAETESSGSISSHSERLSDEQSPEVTSKAAPSNEEVSDGMSTMNERLSAALSNIRAKEELVKQHAKVAEEAVTGWEKAEREVSILKQQLEAAANNNAALEDRVGHLDGALKECVRQLRQSREQSDNKIQEALARSSLEWESKKSGLENRLADVNSQLEASKVECAASISIASDLRPKLDAAEKENEALRHELVLMRQQLELRTVERDLSTQTAEAASKQHLESIKRVAKLEAELRRMKNAARKSYPVNDHVSLTSSAYVDSVKDSHSDSGERLANMETDIHLARSIDGNEYESSQSDSWASALMSELGHFKSKKASGKKAIVNSPGINLMDDFLEMERLAEQEEVENRRCSLESDATSDKADTRENILKAELETAVYRTAELEDKLVRMEMVKYELEMALILCQGQLEESSRQLKDRDIKLRELQNQLSESQDQTNAYQGQLKDAEAQLVNLKCQLALVNDHKRATEAELEAMNGRRHEAESQFEAMKGEMITLRNKLQQSRDVAENERASCKEALAKSDKLEEQFLRLKYEADLRREADLKRVVNSNGEWKAKQVCVLLLVV
ncbi:Filament-like plant protein 3-like protein [Drosera capensis]